MVVFYYKIINVLVLLLIVIFIVIFFIFMILLSNFIVFVKLVFENIMDEIKKLLKVYFEVDF